MKSGVHPQKRLHSAIGYRSLKIKDGEARPGGCMCEPRSDIPPNWNDIRTKFGYTMLGDIT